MGFRDEIYKAREEKAQKSSFREEIYNERAKKAAEPPKTVTMRVGGEKMEVPQAFALAVKQTVQQNKQPFVGMENNLRAQKAAEDAYNKSIRDAMEFGGRMAPDEHETNMAELRELYPREKIELEKWKLGEKVDYAGFTPLEELPEANQNALLEYQKTRRPAQVILEEKKRAIESRADEDALSRYLALRYNPDFAELSAYKTTKHGESQRNTMAEAVKAFASNDPFAGDAVYADTGYGDLAYDAINKNPEAIETAKTQNTFSNLGIYADTAREYLSRAEREHMTEEEVAIFNYLYAKDKQNGTQDAYKFLELLTPKLNARYTEAEKKRAYAMAQEYPVESSFLNIVGTPTKWAPAILTGLDYAADGEVDTNSPYNRATHISNAERAGVSDLIEENAGWFWSGAYDIGMGAAENAYVGFLSGGSSTLAGAIMATTSFGDAVTSAKDRGLTSDQAVSLGFVTAAAELLTEKIGFDKAFDAAKSGGAKALAGAMVSNGLEEMSSEAITTIADVMIAKDKSEWQDKINKYKAQGFSDEEAFGKAFLEVAGEIGYAGVAGMASAGMIVGASGMTNAAMNAYERASEGRALGKEFREGNMTAEDMQTIISEGLATNPDSSSYKLAEKLQRKLDKGEAVSWTEYGKLYNENVRNVDSEAEAVSGAESEGAPVPGFRKNEWSPKISNKQIRALDAIGKKLGVEITIGAPTGNAPGAYNGYYENGRIVIAQDAEDPLEVVLSHEVTHRMKETAPAEYAKFVEIAVNASQKLSDADKAELIKEYKESYGFEGKDADAKAIDEITADYTRKLVHDVSLFRNLVNADRNVAQRFIDSVREFIAKVKSTFSKDKSKADTASIEKYGATVSELEEAVKTWEQMVKATETAVKSGEAEIENTAETEQGGERKNSFKKAQLEIIEKNNPAPNTYQTWIRSEGDIRTLEEAVADSEWDYDEYNPDYTRAMANEAIKKGEIRVYSSYPIEQGVFVTPSKMEAESYSGNGKVYSKLVPISDVAWIDPTQGQYAVVEHTSSTVKEIYPNVPESERAEILGKTNVKIVEYDDTQGDISEETARELEHTYKSRAQQILKALAEKFGLFKNYKNSQIELKFNYSNRSLSESTHTQNMRNPNFSDFAKMLSVFDDVVANAQPIEAHLDKYTGTVRGEENLKQVYVLLGAFRDGSDIVPVEFNIKEFRKNKANKLYVSVTLKRIEADLMGATSKQSASLYTPKSTSVYSIAEIIKNINPSDGDFLKYVPDVMLSEEQLKSKKEAIAREAEKISKLEKKQFSFKKTTENPDIRYSLKTPDMLSREYWQKKKEAEAKAEAPLEVAAERETVTEESGVPSRHALRDETPKTVTETRAVADETPKVAEARGYKDSYLEETGLVEAEVPSERAEVRDEKLDDYTKRLEKHSRVIAEPEEVDEDDDPGAVYRSYVANPASEKKTLGEKVKESTSFVKRKFTNSGDAIRQIAKETKDGALYPAYNQARSSTNIAADMVSNKQTNIRGEKVGESLENILRPIKAKGKTYFNDFHLYLLHKHNIARMSIYNAEAEEAATNALLAFNREFPAFSAMSEDELNRNAKWDDEKGYRAREYIELRRDLRKAREQNKPVFYSGNGNPITAKTSERMVERFIKKYPEFKDYEKNVRTYLDNLMQYRIDSGLVTEDEAEYFRKKYPDYVPTYRATKQVMQQLSGRKDISKTLGRAKGGKIPFIPLDIALAEMTKKVVRNGQKNVFANKLYNDYEKSEALGKYMLDVAEMERDIDSDIDAFGDEAPITDNTVSFYRNGSRIEFVATPDLYEAFDVLSKVPKEQPAIGKAVRSVNDAYKRLITSYDPTFVVRNGLKDLQDAIFNSRDAKAFLKNYPKAFREIATNGKMWQAYQAAGGLSSSRFEDIQEKGIKASEGALQKVKESLPFLNMMVEQAPRLAEFMAVLEKGDVNDADNIADALLAAAEVTTNFGESGTWGKVLNAYYIPFLNPAIQGTAQTIRRFTGTKTSKQWIGLVVKTAFMGLQAGFLNDLLMAIFGDDEAKEDYDNLDDRTKDNYYLFPMGDGNFLKLPKGRVTAALGIVADRTRDVAKGENVDVGEAFARIGENVLPENPLNNNILKAWFDADLGNKESKGRTWYGADIENDRMQSLPVDERYDSTTDELSKWLGKTFNLSPKKVNYILEQYTGGVGRTILPMITPSEQKGDDVLGNIVGGIGSVLTSSFTKDSRLSNKVSGEFYDAVDSAEQAKNSSKATDVDKVVYKYLNRARNNLGEYNTKIRNAESDENLTASGRRAAVRVATAERTAYQKSILENVDKYRESVEKYLDEYPGADGDKRMEYAYNKANYEVYGPEHAIRADGSSTYKKYEEKVRRGRMTWEEAYDDCFGKSDRKYNALRDRFDISYDEFEEIAAAMSRGTTKEEEISAIRRLGYSAWNAELVREYYNKAK